MSAYDPAEVLRARRPRPAVHLRAERDEAVAEVERLRDVAATAVHALLPVVQVTGAWPEYEVTPTIDERVIATAQEWADAAQAVCELAQAVASTPDGGS